jgi:hypothetical protein
MKLKKKRGEIRIYVRMQLEPDIHPRLKKPMDATCGLDIHVGIRIPIYTSHVDMGDTSRNDPRDVAGLK